jgi:3',5'-cyclic AMP phosphodiesterase CpdA
MTTNMTDPQLEAQRLVPRHFIILPTNHEDVLRLKDKLLNFRNNRWKIRDLARSVHLTAVFLLLRLMI